MLNVRLTGDYQCEKLLFTWVSLVMSFMVSMCRFVSHGVGEIWD